MSTAAPLVVAHRRNTLELLRATDPRHGVEVDIRSEGDRLTIHHDPFTPGEDFDAWLAEYRHALLILNVKEEGLETRLLQRMAARGIAGFFFLDQSFPFLMRTLRSGEGRCAVRVSEFEGTETALRLSGQAQWVWLDSFTGALPAATDLSRLANAGFKLCAVSPELQGRPPQAEVDGILRRCEEAGVSLAAVCTKMPELWA